MATPDRFNHTAVYPGTFDPVTFGHLDVIHRGSRLFDNLVVAVGQNPAKAPLFSPAERMALIQEAIGCELPNVGVMRFDGLVVDFLHTLNAHILLRGVRTLTDMEYEFTMVLTNQSLAPNIETVFLMASQEYSFVQAHLIKQVAELGGDISKFVPENVIEPLMRKLGRAG
jgi:pantetheine-phosphate adenylyltransferase